MRVVVAGGSGLIGAPLGARLRASGHTLTTLVRRAPAGPDESRWAPDRGEVDRGLIEASDAIICLSGAGVADHRWTDSYKATLLSSRIDTVGTLARAVADAGGPPTFLAASAVGYYGDTGDRVTDETGARGTGFLAELCERWEAAADPARASGVRVAHLRTGLVLTGKGGLLKRLRPIVKLGVAGRLGTGRQYMPWISMADELSAIEFVLGSDLSGPVNLCGPDPATNAEFTAALGKLLHRPTVIPTPTFALRAVLGELSSDAVAGQRAVPAALLAAGFVHEHGSLESALRWGLDH